MRLRCAGRKTTVFTNITFMLKRSEREEIEMEDRNDQTVALMKRSKMEDSISTFTPTIGNGTLITSTKTNVDSDIVLEGHVGAVYSISFDPSGQHLCSASHDRQIFLWNAFGDCANYNVLSGHKNAVLQVQWKTDGQIVSCSADKTVGIWDTNKGKRIRKLSEHAAVVNSCSVASVNTHLIASASDDCTAILWDGRSKNPISSFYHNYQLCSVCLSSDGRYIYTGGIDNVIRRFDTSMGDSDTADILFAGHSDTVTGLALSPDGNHLLSNAMDSTLRCWDVRPFVMDKSNRCEYVIPGVHHGAEKVLLKCGWSADQNFVSSGSADRLVHIWDGSQFNMLYSLPGHRASVNEVIFHPTKPIVASCGSDKQIFLSNMPAPP